MSEQGRKDDKGKLPYGLLPWRAIEQVVRVLQHGAVKYGAWNWIHVANARERYYDATQRHLTAWWNGEDQDHESGIHHLAHAACDVLFLLAFEIGDLAPRRLEKQRRAEEAKGVPLRDGERVAVKHNDGHIDIYIVHARCGCPCSACHEASSCGDVNGHCAMCKAPA